nr:hypothetical protein CFP56_71423 [Quercus suber]
MSKGKEKVSSSKQFRQWGQSEFVAENVEEGVVEKGKNAVESSTTGLGISKSRKRGRAPSNADDSVLTDLSNQLKEIAVALKEIN